MFKKKNTTRAITEYDGDVYSPYPGFTTGNEDVKEQGFKNSLVVPHQWLHHFMLHTYIMSNIRLYADSAVTL